MSLRGCLRGLGALGLAGTLACAAPPSGEGESESEASDEVEAEARASGDVQSQLETLMRREVELPEPVRVEPEDGGFSVRAAGRLLAPLAATEEFWYGNFDIGTQGSVECWFYRQSDDPASSLKLLWESWFDSLAQQAQLGGRQIQSIDADHVGPDPYLSADWLMVVDQLVYQVKFKYGNKGDRGIYCLHGETGHRRAFDDFFRGLLASYTGATRPEAEFRELMLISVGDTRVGFQKLRAQRDAEGDWQTIVEGSTLLPTGPDSVALSDEFITEWSRPNGSLINQYSVSSDGTDLSRLSLVPAEDVWKVEGVTQGKEVDATFPATPLTSIRGEALAMREVAGAEEGAELRYQRWLGTVQPSAPVEHVARSTGGDTVEVQAGPLVVSGRVDGRGTFESGTIEMGRIVMDVQRVYIEGEL